MNEELGKELNILKGHALRVKSCNFSPCGNFIVSGSSDNTVKNWEFTSGSLIKTLKGHTQCISLCNFSPCGNFIVSRSGDHTVKIWDVSPLVLSLKR